MISIDRATIIAAHRERYRLHAGALLLNPEVKEFRYHDDCGFHFHPVDRHFVHAVERHVGIAENDDFARRNLCDQISRGETVPALESYLDGYVTRLRGSAN